MTPTFTVRSRPPFRAEHVGSLIRPATLYQMRKDNCKCSPSELKAIEDESVKAVVRLQEEVGLRTVTDGEQRRGMFFEGVFDKLEGMITISNRPISTFKPYIPHIAIMYAQGIQESETIFCNGKIKRTKPFYVEEFKYLKSITAPENVKYLKVTMCPPTWFHQRHGSDLTYDTSVYRNDDAYFNDLAIAYRQEIDELYRLGCRHIQFDDPTLAYFCDETMIVGMENAGVNHEALLDTYIRAHNLVAHGRPDDMTFSVHMCRGNYRGFSFSQGGYERISHKVFNSLDVDVLYLEYDNERAGDFSPLKYLPLNKIAVLGLVTTKNPKLETVEELKARVNQAVGVLVEGSPKRSREVALNQLCISPQCGFASTWEGNPITEEDQRKKLEVLVEAAKQIWPAEMH
ncbi:hypothetical protein CPB83DRAFT_865696 [Crepidotus variabilis]|uniref:Cobalamin-independent methionine synthase MetE C-terminal/archaeal domain-containing protein n=1 Tax=Crepidotus variabilis TaxID=179855 RepID=A0A9P6JWQ2_9AGAR|nr:hypothetical protein CPB83DRAFT_865696 [Crepidotus variabilis]